MSGPVGELEPHLSARDSEQLGRRRRARNWAMLIALVLMVALFYAISIVKMTKG